MSSHRKNTGNANTGKTPTFTSESYHFRVVLPNVNDVPENLERPAAAYNTDELSDDEVTIMELLKSNPFLSIQKIAEMQNKSVKEIRTIRTSLKNKSKIERVGVKKGGYWKLN